MKIDYELIGNRIREKRLAKHMTQSELADRTNLSEPYISYLENANKRPSIQTLMVIANALGTTVNEILGDNQEYNSVAYRSDIDTLMSDCNRYEKRIILDTAKAIKTSIRENIGLLEVEVFLKIELISLILLE